MAGPMGGAMKNRRKGAGRPGEVAGPKKGEEAGKENRVSGRGWAVLARQGVADPLHLVEAEPGDADWVQTGCPLHDGRSLVQVVEGLGRAANDPTRKRLWDVRCASRAGRGHGNREHARQQAKSNEESNHRDSTFRKPLKNIGMRLSEKPQQGLGFLKNHRKRKERRRGR